MFFMWMFGIIIFICLLVYVFLILRHREKANLINFLSYLILGVAFFIVFHIIALMVHPFKIQEIDQPIPVLNPNHEIKRGESVILKPHVKKYVDKGSMIYPSLLCDDGYYTTYPTRASNLPMGEQEVIITSAYSIPMDAPIGATCHTRATDIFTLNLFRSVSFILESEPFKIIE